jgi:hypothetical protein
MEKFEQVIRDGYQFDFNGYLKKGWDLFAKGAGSMIGFYIIMIIILLIINFIPFASLASGFFLEAALAGGFFIFVRQMLSEKDNFNQFFEGFNHFGQLAIFVLVRFLFFLPLIVILFTMVFPFELLIDSISGSIDPEYFSEEFLLSFQDNFGFIFIFMLIFLAGTVYIYMSYSLTIPLIVDAKLDFWQAMEVSRRIVGKKFFMFLLLFIVVGILVMLGTLVTCGFGILVAGPYGYCLIFAIYDDILKPQDEDLTQQISDFGVQEKDINTEAEDDAK